MKSDRRFARLVPGNPKLCANRIKKKKKKKKKNLFSKLAYKISNKKSRNGRLPERPYGHPGWRS